MRTHIDIGTNPVGRCYSYLLLSRLVNCLLKFVGKLILSPSESRFHTTTVICGIAAFLVETSVCTKNDITHGTASILDSLGGVFVPELLTLLVEVIQLTCLDVQVWSSKSLSVFRRSLQLII
jgi:hypothetical protein